MKEKSASSRVLIVDDEPHVTMVLAEGLERLGKNYIIETASNGDAALAKIGTEDYALVITDYRMPGLSGLELAQAVRRISPQTQVVLMTAYGTSGLRDQVGELELDYIDKPFSVAQIREIVENAVGRVRPSDGEPAEFPIEQPVSDKLTALQINTGARCVLLLSSNGYTIEVAGQTAGLDVPSMVALVAANFMAASELARMLGNASVFKSSYHEGPDYNIYSYEVSEDLLLAVVFGSETKPGTVWYYTKQTAAELAPIFEGVQATMAHNLADMSGFAEELGNEFDKAFGFAADESSFDIEADGASETEIFDANPQERELMDIETAIAQGLIPKAWE
ncbi:MAG: response regulator [Anaerolineae bacterium]|nr:response regulator [Anaerolineae bacterium]